MLEVGSSERRSKARWSTAESGFFNHSGASYHLELLAGGGGGVVATSIEGQSSGCRNH